MRFSENRFIDLNLPELILGIPQFTKVARMQPFRRRQNLCRLADNKKVTAASGITPNLLRSASMSPNWS
jgi:hypothetical protein